MVVMSFAKIAEELGLTERQVIYSYYSAIYKLLLLYIEEMEYDFEEIALSLDMTYDDFVEMFLSLRESYYIRCKSEEISLDI